MTAPIRVVMDCDTANEIDDQIAIAHALGSPSLDVLGVISVQNTVAHGRASRDLYQEEAVRVVGLCGRTSDVPCLRGADKPMEDTRTAVRSEGLDFLVQAAEAGPITLVATGPATDVASLALAAPHVLGQLSVVWAGGFPDDATWQRKKFGELNARADIAAWRRLFLDPVPLRLLPGWPGVETVALPWRECVDRFRALHRPVADYLAGIVERYAAERGVSLDMDDDRASEKKVIWDIVNVAALTTPDAVTFTRQQLPSVDPAGVPDWTVPGRQADVGLDVDPVAVLEDLWAALERLPQTVGPEHRVRP